MRSVWWAEAYCLGSRVARPRLHFASNQRTAKSIGAATEGKPQVRLYAVRQGQAGLDEAFFQTAPDNKVLFYLPVTKAWLRQLVLALILICHSSLRGVVALLRDLFRAFGH